MTFQFPRIIKGKVTATVTAVLNEDASTLKASGILSRTVKATEGDFPGANGSNLERIQSQSI